MCGLGLWEIPSYGRSHGRFLLVALVLSPGIPSGMAAVQGVGDLVLVSFLFVLQIPELAAQSKHTTHGQKIFTPLIQYGDF